MKPVTPQETNAIRRKLFEKPITEKQVRNYIKNHNLRISWIVVDCFKQAKAFNWAADCYQKAIQAGLHSHRLFKLLVINLRNGNYWLWLALYLAKIEDGYHVDLATDADKVVVGDYDPDLKSLIKFTFKDHEIIKNWGPNLPYQSDSKYPVKF